MSRSRVILIGNDEGVARAAGELGAIHVPDVECSDYGTPLLASIFEAAEQLAPSDLLCYINADVILTSDFPVAVDMLSGMERFLMIGQRWNVDVDSRLDFDDPEWERRLREKAISEGHQEPPDGIDYFLYRPRGLWGELPPFVIGRPMWDNWFIYHARRSGVPVVDATEVVMAIHQNHGYGHVPDAKGPPILRDNPETSVNRRLAGKIAEIPFNIHNSTHKLTPSGVKRARGLQYTLQAIASLPAALPDLWFDGGLPLFLVRAYRFAIYLLQSAAIYREYVKSARMKLRSGQVSHD